VQRLLWLVGSGAVAVGATTLTLSAGRTAQPAAAPSQPATAPAPQIPGPVANPNAAASAADHKQMLEQLGIKVLRPGPSGNETAPNHANYDEALANPYPNLPETLVLKSGERVTTPEVWWKQRRPEIVEDCERDGVGRVPPNVPKVTWTVVA